MEFSIVVPVYNAERYLRGCIDSILQQSYPHWECLLIDDGSTDGSLRICEEYAASDSRIKVVHKSNGGVSSARNLGIGMASKEWLVFIDSDDSITSDYLERMSKASDCGVDLILTGHIEVFPQKEVLKPLVTADRLLQKAEVADFLQDNLAKLPLVSPWAKAIRRELIEEMGLRFNPQMKLGEDCVFCFSYFCHMTSVYVVANSLYKYRISTNSGAYAMDQATTLRHLKAISMTYNKLCQTWRISSPSYNTFHAYSYLRSYCRYLRQQRKWMQESYGNIASVMNNPFVVAGLFTNHSGSLLSKRAFFEIGHKVSSRLHMLRYFFYALSKIYIK